MAKKGLIASLILGAVLTLSLGIYTLVAAILANTNPINEGPIVLAYTHEQSINAFAGYSEENGNLKFEYAEGQEGLLVYNAEDGTYSVNNSIIESANVGDTFKFTAIATTDKKGSTKTYNVTIYKNGNGSDAANAHYIVNTEGLVELQKSSIENYRGVATSYIVMAEDIDLAGIEWDGLFPNGGAPFSGTFVANGKAIKNMSIHITSENCAQHVSRLTDKNNIPYSTLTIGLFGNTYGATINGVAMENANIVIDPNVLSTIKNDARFAELDYIRVGLLVGDARNTTFDGEVTVPAVGEESEETKVNAKISGTINGYSYGVETEFEGDIYPQTNGIGGLAGVIQDYNIEHDASSISNYVVNLNVTNSIDQKGNYIGGVAGEILAHTEKGNIVINNIETSLTSNATFNNRNNIGALSGKVHSVTATNITTTINVSAQNTRENVFIDWHNSADRDLRQLTNVAGIVATVTSENIDKMRSTFENVISNATIDVYSNVSAGFVYVENSDIINVETNGKLIGYSATGLAVWLYNSDVEYSKETNLNLDLAGWYTASLADYAQNTNIIAKNNCVNIDVVINAKGYVQTGSTAIQNTLHSAGLVGYFYSTDESFENEYVLSGFDLTVTMYNVTDAGGLVTYLGNDSQLANAVSERTVISNCSATVTITSNTSAHRSSTHKVGGAVATIYGVATLDNIDIVLCFNPNQTIGNKYGAAMFGGLVARLAGEYVTINNCTTTGDAYINDSAYTTNFAEQETQILAGGLIGAIAGFGKEIDAGSHPVFGESAPNGVPSSATFDNLVCIDTTKLSITSNTADVNITIDYREENTNDGGTCMGASGYLSRAVGSFIGLVMNGIYDDSGNKVKEATELDLSDSDKKPSEKNKALGSVRADKYTFTFLTNSAPATAFSSMGYGRISDNNKTAICIGISFDMVGTKLETGESYVKLPN